MAESSIVYLDCGEDERRENARCIVEFDAHLPSHELCWYGFQDGLSVWLYPSDRFTVEWCRKKRIRRKKISLFDIQRKKSR